MARDEPGYRSTSISTLNYLYLICSALSLRPLLQLSLYCLPSTTRSGQISRGEYMYQMVQTIMHPLIRDSVLMFVQDAVSILFFLPFLPSFPSSLSSLPSILPHTFASSTDSPSHEPIVGNTLRQPPTPSQPWSPLNPFA